MTEDSITRSVLLRCDPASARARFVQGFADWWPREHCFCGEASLDRVFLDPDAGTWGEVRRDGVVVPWGTAAWELPAQDLRLGWQMDATVSPWVPEPDPARASQIDITFVQAAGGTRVTLCHHGFLRQGARHAQAMWAVMAGLDRWREWLDLYAAATPR